MTATTSATTATTIITFVPQFPFYGSTTENNITTRKTSSLLKRRPRTSTISFTTNRTQRQPRSVFLPPNGLPSPVDDDEDLQQLNDLPNEGKNNGDAEMEVDDEQLLSSSSITEEYQNRRSQIDSIDKFLEGTKPEYDTWYDRNSKRSLSTFSSPTNASGLLGAEELNESLRANHLQRHRHILKPDEKFGAIFTWDTLMSNSRELELKSWEILSKELNMQPPDMEDIIRSEDTSPELAITRIFYWDVPEWSEVKKITHRKQEIYIELEKEFSFKLNIGILKFMQSLNKYGIKCILCIPTKKRSHIHNVLKDIDNDLVNDIFKSKNDIIGIEDEIQSLEQMFLVACLKCERPPNHCVVFTDKPNVISAAHDITCKVIGLVGTFPAYTIKSADHVIGDFDDLVVYNVRRLFSEEGMEFLDPQTELEEIEEPSQR